MKTPAFRLILLAGIITLSSFVCQAQIYVPGSIIRQTGDTIRGMVLKTSTQALLRECVFARNGDITHYAPTQLQGFTIENRRFRSHTFSSGKATFLLLLNEGPLSLLTDESLFYVRSNKTDTLMTLISNVTRTINGQQTDVLWFRNQLTFVTQDCPIAAGLIARAQYNAGSLSPVVAEYNECVDPSTTYTIQSGKPIVRFGVKVIGGYSQCEYNAYNGIRFTNGYMGGLGGFLQLKANHLSTSRITAQAEVLYLHHAYSSRYSHSYLSVPFLLQYALTRSGKHTYIPFAEIGLQPNFTTTFSLSPDMFPIVSNLAISLPIGIGIQPRLTAKPGTGKRSRQFSFGMRYFRLTNSGSNRIHDFSVYTGLLF